MSDIITSEIASIGRLGSSRSGNPKWEITLVDGRRFETATDTADAGKLTGGEAGRSVTLTLNRGEIVGIEVGRR